MKISSDVVIPNYLTFVHLFFRIKIIGIEGIRIEIIGIIDSIYL